MLRYAITDRRLYAGTEAERRLALVTQAGRLSKQNVDYLQIREKDLPPDDLLELTLAIQHEVSLHGERTRVLLNGSADLALAAGVGLHLPYSQWIVRQQHAVSVSCHTPEEVKAISSHAEIILFGPVFEKSVVGERVQQGCGLAAMTEACALANGVPVLALGGVDAENAGTCIAAGAQGIAGIRIFLQTASSSAKSG